MGQPSPLGRAVYTSNIYVRPAISHPSKRITKSGHCNIPATGGFDPAGAGASAVFTLADSTIMPPHPFDRFRPGRLTLPESAIPRRTANAGNCGVVEKAAASEPPLPPLDRGVKSKPPGKGLLKKPPFQEKEEKPRSPEKLTPQPPLSGGLFSCPLVRFFFTLSLGASLFLPPCQGGVGGVAFPGGQRLTKRALPFYTHEPTRGF